MATRSGRQVVGRLTERGAVVAKSVEGDAADNAPDGTADGVIHE